MSKAFRLLCNKLTEKHFCRGKAENAKQQEGNVEGGDAVQQGNDLKEGECGSRVTHWGFKSQNHQYHPHVGSALTPPSPHTRGSPVCSSDHSSPVPLSTRKVLLCLDRLSCSLAAGNTHIFTCTQTHTLFTCPVQQKSNCV